VVKLEEFTVVFKYAGEDAEQTVSKLAIGKIIYKSGREEEISEKIVVSSKADWGKVEILIDKSQLVGLSKVAEVQGKTTGFFAEYTTAAGTDKRSMRKLLEAAAEMGCPFVFMTADKDTKGGMQSGAFGAQGNKKGIAYKY
jgi:dihydroorotase-like cyclic amidohydrolase